MNKHTPGPWSVVQGHYPSFKDVIGPSFKINAVMWATDLTDDDYYKRMADLNLIAAAPDLLEALKSFIDCWSDDMGFSNPYPEDVRKAKAAIAKATGEQL
jgi:hypothetical protein